MRIIRSAAIGVIKIARYLLLNTPVAHWKVTGIIRRKLFHSVYGTGKENGETQITYFGVKLTFPSNDSGMVPGLVGGFYEKHELTLFEKICKRSKYVVDVGANIGLYTTIAAKQGCMVSAFEPVPENIHYLQKNIADNNFTDSVTVHKKAVGATPGTAKIYLMPDSIGQHSMAQKVAGSSDSLDVEVITLDTYKPLQKKRCDVLKIDVEGYDGYVLEGAEKLLAKQKPTLFIEFVPLHLKNTGYDCMHFLNIIYKYYKQVYKIDERNGSRQIVSKNDLIKTVTANRSTNLVALGAQHEEMDIVS